MEDVFGFKFSLDLSDFEKAPKTIAEALDTIKGRAEANGKNADLAMAKYLQDMMKERENALRQLEEQLEKATQEYASIYADMRSGKATPEDVIKAKDNMDKLSESVSTLKGELSNLQNAEKELSKDRNLITQIRAKAQSFDLYGKAMALLPAPIANVIQGSKLLNKSLMALATNPLVIVFTGLVILVKELYQWFDSLADRSDGIAYVFGTITGVVDKLVRAFNELIDLNLEGFLYNIKTMFDGGEREVAKRNEDLKKAEEAGLRERLQRDNQFLRRRINNSKLDMKERLEAEKQYTENLKKIEETRREELQRKMTEWAKKNGYKTADNPDGWATKKGDLEGPLQVELQEMENEMARIDNAIANIDLESGDRRTKLNEEVNASFEKNMQDLESMIQKRKEYNRSVAEQMEAESQRLKQMAQQTENQAIQAQINKMADGIEKVTAQAKQKTKEALQSLDKALYDEAYKLWGDEKKLFDGNPSNEGKMFKSFKIGDYIQQAKKNIGYEIKEGLISDTEIDTTKKAVDAIVKDALDGAKKVADEVSDVITRIEDLSNGELPAIFGGDVSLGFKEYKSDLERIRTLTEEAKQVSEELTDLEKERLTLENKLNSAKTNEEKISVTNKIKDNAEATNKALEKAKKTENELKLATDSIKGSYDKMLDTVNMIGDAISNCAEQFKGMSESGDEVIESLQEMLSIVGRLASGDYIGAIIQMVFLAVQKVADYFKRVKEEESKRKEYVREMVGIYRSVTEAVYTYRQALIDAKYAKDDLWANTNVGSMLKYYEKEQQALKDFTERQDDLYKRTTERNGVLVGSALYNELIQQGATQSNFYSKEGTQRTDMKTENWYDALTVGYKDWKNQGELLKYVLADRGMAQLYDDVGNFNLEAYNALKETSDLWDGLGEQAQKDIELVAKSAEEYRKYKEELEKAMVNWYSPLLDNMTDAWMDWLKTGEKVMDKFKDYSSSTFSDIIKDILKKKLFDNAFNAFNEDIESYTNDYLDSGNDKTYATQIAERTDALMKQIEKDSSTYESVMSAYSEALKSKGIDITQDSSSGTAEARGIARASQESVDENNARLAMMQQHTYSINANVQLLTQTSSQMLYYLQGIHSHTSELSRLSKIESSLSNIENYGVRTR